jgi:L-fucose isomerase-like protein
MEMFDLMDYYRKTNRFKLGFAPTRRAISWEKAFNKNEAMKQKSIIEMKAKSYGVELVNLDFLNEEGLLYDGRDAETVARQFMASGVDALFVPHCNFGNEEAVAKLAKKVNKPVLLWGPRDDAPLPDGNRLRDSQCGLFATSKVLSRYGVPFTYITNCRIEDELFDRGFRNFLGAASAVKAFTNLRVGQISTRPGSFWSVKSNEAELLERFGIEVVPITMTDLKQLIDATLKERFPEIQAAVAELKRKIKQIEFGEDDLIRTIALKLAIRHWAEDEGLTAAVTQCWGPMVDTAGICPCFTLSELTEDGLPVICEGDIHGAITAVLAQGANFGKEPNFLADITVRHPEDDQTELLWHCGVFPKALAKKSSELVLSRHFNRKRPATGAWELREGDITLTRFDGAAGNYSLLMGHGKGVPGPATVGTYVWVKFNDWPQWEHRFIYGPYIHHCIGIYGKIAPALFEACRYIPGLKADPVDPSAAEIEEYLRG